MYNQGVKSIMCSLFLSSLYTNDLLNYKNGVIKNMLRESMMCIQCQNFIDKINF